MEKIVAAVGAQQCWDMVLNGTTLTIATYNQGLFLFNYTTGKQIKHFNQKNLNRIRRLRFINGQLYCVARQGIYQIYADRVVLRFSSIKELPPNNMPLDVFFWDNKMHVIGYPKTMILQQQSMGKWVDLGQVLLARGKKLPSLYPSVISAYEYRNQIFLGGVNHYVVLDSVGNTKQYFINSKGNESWALWDFQAHKGQVYAAVSNTADFNEGYLHAHDPEIINYQPLHNESLWSITPSKFRDALWLSAETNGVHLAIQPNKRIIKQTHFVAQIDATADFIVRYNPNFLSIQNTIAHQKKNKKDLYVELTVRDLVKKVAQIDDQLYIMGANNLWHFNPETQTIDSIIQTNTFQTMIEFKGQLWLFQPYGLIYVYNPKTKEFRCTQQTAQADCIRKNQTHIFYHIMGEGFAYIDEKGKKINLKSKIPFTQYTLNFEVLDTKILIENGSSYDIYQINLQKNTLEYLNKINFIAAFREIPIKQTFAKNNNLVLYTGSNLIEIDISNPRIPIKIVKQQYLGKWHIHGHVAMAGNGYAIDRGSTVQEIEIETFPITNFSVNLSYRDDGPNIFLPYYSINIDKNFKVVVAGPHFFDHLRSIYAVELTNIKINDSMTNKQYGFFRGDGYYWTDGIGMGKFNFAVSHLNVWRSQFIIGTTEYYRDFPFWLMLISFITLLYWVFYNQAKNQESQQKRIATLQLQTLRSNFNPHFIYNSMSLIQSLIIASETKKAIDVTARLAKLNRTFLTNSNKELIYLKVELDFIKDYVAMEKMRFESDTQFPFRIDIGKGVEVNEWLIPPLILQPLVENAIKHGVLASKQPAQIDVKITLARPNQLCIEIINRPTVPNKKKATGLGMGNTLVADRLGIFNELYPNQFQAKFTFGYREVKEYCVQIQIERFTKIPQRGITGKISSGIKTVKTGMGGGKSF